MPLTSSSERSAGIGVVVGRQQCRAEQRRRATGTAADEIGDAGRTRDHRPLTEGTAVGPLFGDVAAVARCDRGGIGTHHVGLAAGLGHAGGLEDDALTAVGHEQHIAQGDVVAGLHEYLRAAGERIDQRPGLRADAAEHQHVRTRDGQVHVAQCLRQGGIPGAARARVAGRQRHRVARRAAVGLVAHDRDAELPGKRSGPVDVVCQRQRRARHRAAAATGQAGHAHVAADEFECVAPGLLDAGLLVLCDEGHLGRQIDLQYRAEQQQPEHHRHHQLDQRQAKRLPSRTPAVARRARGCPHHWVHRRVLSLKASRAGSPATATAFSTPWSPRASFQRTVTVTTRVAALTTTEPLPSGNACAMRARHWRRSVLGRSLPEPGVPSGRGCTNRPTRRRSCPACVRSCRG